MIKTLHFDCKPDFSKTTHKLVSAVELPSGIWKCEVLISETE